MEQELVLCDRQCLHLGFCQPDTINPPGSLHGQTCPVLSVMLTQTLYMVLVNFKCILVSPSSMGGHPVTGWD
jgi:hypothetical protein